MKFYSTCKMIHSENAKTLLRLKMLITLILAIPTVTFVPLRYLVCILPLAFCFELWTRSKGLNRLLKRISLKFKENRLKMLAMISSITWCLSRGTLKTTNKTNAKHTNH